MDPIISDAPPEDWLHIRHDHETGIESVHGHFHGQAYDPHDHDEVLVGVTQQGVQQFSCHRSLHVSTPGNAILIEPGAIHDGHAPDGGSFTYAMLYLPQAWLAGVMQRLGPWDISALQPAFRSTLTQDALLNAAIQRAFCAVHQQEGRLARDQRLDDLIRLLIRHLRPADPRMLREASFRVARARDYLHDQMALDIGLDELAEHSGMDRFRLTRQFKQTFGLAPHAYLVRLRLRAARALLAQGREPASVALEVGFADQSHLGRWFQRVYRLSPAAYQRACTNVLDPAAAGSDDGVFLIGV